MAKIILVGAGGHAKVILAMLQMLDYEVVGLVDDKVEAGKSVLNVKVLGPCSLLENFAGIPAVCALGDNLSRQTVAEKYDQLAWQAIIHPRAYVHESVQLGMGTVVFAGAVIQPDAVLGKHVIVNTAASVDHDCEIGDYTHIAPGSHLGGGVKIGEGAFVGLGSKIKPYIEIGAWSTLGAGSVVVKHIPNHVTAKGVPAKV